MSHNLIIGLGNCGTEIIKAITKSELLSDAKLYAIDSVASSIDLSSIDRVKVIPIISDEKNGSGRNRERGAEMYNIHESNNEFAEMYNDAKLAKSPVIVITSSAGGTGSGSSVCLCKSLVKRGIKVIPIIITPDMSEPVAFHLNTNDLFVELADIKDAEGADGISTYSIFQNPKDTANYDKINSDVVSSIEIILGKCYDHTKRDSIDDSDLDMLLSTPGRFIAATATAPNIDMLRKAITQNVLSGYQPGWNVEEVANIFLMTGYSLSSMFADEDFASVFADIRKRTPNTYDEFRNISSDPNKSECKATVIVTGLPHPPTKNINLEYNVANSIGEGVKKSVRPKFLKKKKVVSKPIVDESSNIEKDISRFGDAKTLAGFDIK